MGLWLGEKPTWSQGSFLCFKLTHSPSPGPELDSELSIPPVCAIVHTARGRQALGWPDARSRLSESDGARRMTVGRGRYDLIRHGVPYRNCARPDSEGPGPT